MDALLVFNRSNVKNLRVMVQVTEKKVKEKVINLLEEDKGDEAFDVLVREGQVQLYIPGEMPLPKTPYLIVLDEQLLKSKLPAELSGDYIQKDNRACYT